MAEVNSAPSRLVEKLGFDPDALRIKYRQERDKRLRNDGNAQYRDIQGELSGFLDDPYVEDHASRAPLNDEVDVVIVDRRSQQPSNRSELGCESETWMAERVHGEFQYPGLRRHSGRRSGRRWLDRNYP